MPVRIKSLLFVVAFGLFVFPCLGVCQIDDVCHPGELHKSVSLFVDMLVVILDAVESAVVPWK